MRLQDMVMEWKERKRVTVHIVGLGDRPQAEMGKWG